LSKNRTKRGDRVRSTGAKTCTPKQIESNREDTGGGRRTHALTGAITAGSTWPVSCSRAGNTDGGSGLARDKEFNSEQVTRQNQRKKTASATDQKKTTDQIGTAQEPDRVRKREQLPQQQKMDLNSKTKSVQHHTKDRPELTSWMRQRTEQHQNKMQNIIFY
jgi:hypothetical protein